MTPTDYERATRAGTRQRPSEFAAFTSVGTVPAHAPDGTFDLGQFHAGIDACIDLFAAYRGLRPGRGGGASA